MAIPETKQRIIKSKSVKSAYYLRRRSAYTTLYLYPSILLYAIWIILKIFVFAPVDEGELDFPTMLLILFCTSHCLSYLGCDWNSQVARKIRYNDVDNIRDAQEVLIVPEKHHGAPMFCVIKVIKLKQGGDETDVPSIMYQNRRYLYDFDKKMFTKILYPDDTEISRDEFISYSGISQDTQELSLKYGENMYEVPSCTFLSLLMEHILSPLFIFQVFSVFMWILDGMWNYSVFVLVALTSFESMIVVQRLKTMKEFRSINSEPYDIRALRNNVWITVKTNQLFPGDLVSLSQDCVGKALMADMILINGSCVVDEAVMTGESTPQVREGVAEGFLDTPVTAKNYPQSAVYGGTAIIQVIPSQMAGVRESPNNGILAFVTRTGFSTKQGKLIKKIIFNSEKVGASSSEPFHFILFLLFFAVIAAIYVWVQGTKDESRKKGSVLLECVLIVISSVPPELPTEISLSVNHSLTGLRQNFIFCMEPFRVPFAGRIDVACFDKTGTLTKLDLIMEGVVLESDGELHPPTEISDVHKRVLASAHGVVCVNGSLIGDPMEKHSVKSVNWVIGSNNIVYPNNDVLNSGIPQSGAVILRKYPFFSALKRMSTLSVNTSELISVSPLVPKKDEVTIWVSCKGAPEVISGMISDLKDDYNSMYKSWVKRGRRVIAFAYKKIVVKVSKNGNLLEDIAKLRREDVEKDLQFLGLLIFGCPLKPDAGISIQKIMNSSHRVIMITGDNAFTACHISSELGLLSRSVVIADLWDGKNPSWRTLDEDIEFKINPEDTSFDKRLDKYDMCMTGPALELLGKKAWLSVYCSRIWVYARISPSQKEDVIIALKNKGYCTMMCGDGTNDVGALKSAHVGVAILNGDPDALEKERVRSVYLRQIKALEQQQKIRKSFGMGDIPEKSLKSLEEMRLKVGIKPGVSVLGYEESLKKNQEAGGKVPTTEELMSGLFESLESDDLPNIKPGDASVAAPFTSKVSSMDSVVKIICQGRATLIAILQTYKILALNCIISAYSLSSLSLSGVKQSDLQATVAGLMTTACFLGISKSKLLPDLSKQRPQKRVFGSYVLFSIVGQAIVHVLALTLMRQNALKYSEDDMEELLDEKFYPNLLNTSIYLLELVTQVSVFCVNYQGHPFRQSLRNNKPLWNSVLFVSIFVAMCISGVLSPLNNVLELVPFDENYRNIMIKICLADVLGAWLVEKVCLFFLMDSGINPELYPHKS